MDSVRIIDQKCMELSARSVAMPPAPPKGTVKLRSLIQLLFDFESLGIFHGFAPSGSTENIIESSTLMRQEQYSTPLGESVARIRDLLW
ncbi:MAG: hypothetical protein AB8B64_12895 [Granulosicoccus sp.]